MTQQTDERGAILETLWVPRNPLAQWQITRFAEAVEITPAQALGHIVALMLWARDNFPMGVAERHLCSDATLARAAGWTGDAGQFTWGLDWAEFTLYTGEQIFFYWWGGYGSLDKPDVTLP